jgi:hypothetical protein
MEKYIFVFLMFWFNTTFAPNLSKMERKQLNQIAITVQEPIESTSDIYLDSIDMKTVKHFKMSSTFTKEDRKKIRSIAKDLGIRSQWLYKIFYIEMDKDKYGRPILKGRPNIHSGAVGLIGFLPSTAVRLGTTTEDLQEMTVLQQLDYVHKYFKLALRNKKMHKASDVYLAIFSPIDLHKHDSTVIGKDRIYNGKKVDISKKVYRQNKIVDMNKDSLITIKDINLFMSML